jgi:OOP family OmpA-OmpF porin
MMNHVKTLVLGGCLIALAGCTNFKAHSEVEALNEAKAVGSPFTQFLASEYRDFSNRELNEMFDYPDALHFARKGLATAGGETVLPEPISDWNLLPNHMEELGTARGRLITAFDLGAREVAPKEAAIAQSRFDCWIEQQEENWQENDIASCKAQFMEAMNNLEGMLQPKAPEVAVAPEAPVDLPQAEPMKPEDAMYLIFYDFNSSKIGAGADSVLDAVSGEVKGRSVGMINIVGHADTSGPKSYNNKLSMRRANAARDALAGRGVDPSIIRVEGKGEDELLVPTADDVREPANRRSQITFQ